MLPTRRLVALAAASFTLAVVSQNANFTLWKLVIYIVFYRISLLTKKCVGILVEKDFYYI